MDLAVGAKYNNDIEILIYRVMERGYRNEKKTVLCLLMVLSMLSGCLDSFVFAETAQTETVDYGGKIKINQNNVTGGTGYKGSSYLKAVDGDYSTYYDGLQG